MIDVHTKRGNLNRYACETNAVEDKDDMMILEAKTLQIASKTSAPGDSQGMAVLCQLSEETSLAKALLSDIWI